jgi:hypothetical protein
MMEPFGLSKRETEDGAQRQRGGDRQAGVMRLSARRGARFRLPGGDRLIREPDGEAAPVAAKPHHIPANS